MKRIFSISLIVIITIMLLLGCQATPKRPVVIGKDTEQMIDSAKEGGEGSVILKAVDAPDTYKADLANAKGNIVVHVDANVILPNTDKIPTATVDKQEFSQETADKLMKLLLQGQTLYDVKSYFQPTKADIQKRLTELYAMRAGTIPVQVDSGDLDGSIQLWEQRLAEAPETVQKNPALTTFHKNGAKGLEPYDYIEGITEINGKSAYFYIRNQTQENKISVIFVNSSQSPDLMGGTFQPVNMINGVSDANISKPSVSIEQVQAQTDAFIHELGLAHLVHSVTELGIKVGTVPNEGVNQQPQNLKSVYIVRFEREVNGAPITYTRDQGTAVEDGYAASWPYEAITFVIDDSGIIEFYWTSPYTEPEIVTDDTKLLPFPEIKQVFEKMIMVKNSWTEGTSVQMDIDTVQLGLMRIVTPNQGNTGVLVPVWDFFGTTTYKNDEEQLSRPRDSLLTINAVDGTVIDRSVGY